MRRCLPERSRQHHHPDRQGLGRRLRPSRGDARVRAWLDQHDGAVEGPGRAAVHPLGAGARHDDSRGRASLSAYEARQRRSITRNARHKVISKRYTETARRYACPPAATPYGAAHHLHATEETDSGPFRREREALARDLRTARPRCVPWPVPAAQPLASGSRQWPTKSSAKRRMWPR